MNQTKNQNKELSSTMNKKNDDAPPSPSEVTTTCSMSTANNTDGTSVATTDETTLDRRRRRMQEQILHLSIASGTAVSGLIIAVVPVPILLLLLVVAGFLMSLLFKIYQRLRLEMQTALHGHGFGGYLPASIYDQLVRTSIHEWMMDGSFMEEYQFLALYFVPGVTSEQLEAYVDRLVPRHRNLVRRPGLGHVLGAGFMRLIVGDEGLANLTTTARATPVPRRLELTQHGEPNALQEEEDGDDERASLPGGEVTATPVERAAAPVARVEVQAAQGDEAAEISEDRGIIDFFTGGDDDDDEEEEDLSEEANIIIDAMTAAMNNYTNQAVEAVSSYARELTTTVSSAMVRTGLSVGMASLGVGLFGIFMGYWQPPTRVAQRFPDVRWERSNILLGSSLASGATAGFFMMWSGGRGGGSTSASAKDSSAKGSNDKTKT